MPQNLSNDTTLAYLFRKVESAIKTVKDSLTALIDGKVSKAGDTMTGKLRIRCPDMDVDVLPGDNIWYDGVVLCDKNGEELGSLQLYQATDGTIGTALQARRTVNGNTTWHKLNIEQ